VTGVQFRLQGANLGAEDTTNPYSTSWNTTTVPNGSYTLTAIARDAAGNTTTSATRTVTVSNTSPSPPSGGGAPVTAWTAAAQNPGASWNNSSWDNRSIRILLKGSSITTNGTTVQLTLQGRSSGNYTVQRVSLVRRDGTTLNGVNSTHRQLTFGGTWNAGGTVPAGGTLTSDPIPFDLIAGQDVFVTFWVPNGNPTVYRNGGNNTIGWTITGTDQSAVIDWGSLSTSNTTQNIYVIGKLDVLPTSGGDTTSPTVTLTAPSAGTVSGSVTITANANDNVGVIGVQFRLQGANLGAEDTTNPYSTSWNTTTVPNGSYTLTAIARDAAGNTTSATRTVTVSNTTAPPPPPTSTLNISNLNVSSGKGYVVPTSGLQAGGTVYIDRSYTFSTIPTLVQGGAYIRTANDDKAATNINFLSFTVNQPVSVYVAHGDRISPKPAWLNTFTDTGTNLVTSDTTLSLFVRTFPAGTITLGGNVSSGNAGNSLSMYSVIIKP
ncbi:Ig-like domain-containing protein, partial [Nitrospira sp. T9]|uniref:Ig-like domain-containing protein n=1 Tax=unclassified Nitrospira TaxID=2652172 RepID=UPI003F954AAB